MQKRAYTDLEICLNLWVVSCVKQPPVFTSQPLTSTWPHRFFTLFRGILFPICCSSYFHGILGFLGCGIQCPQIR